MKHATANEVGAKAIAHLADATRLQTETLYTGSLRNTLEYAATFYDRGDWARTKYEWIDVIVQVGKPIVATYFPKD